ncbi:ligase-associated DNA damage response endonuclease PdeM [Chitinophaga sp. XS-30]|nr:ligase-associated DNA damage response endonuclease PdeM [Chitinophaga sp. XS-30]
MLEDVSFEWKEQHWRLSAGRAVYWEEEQTLILADLHAGKSAHFRKAGIAVPANIVQEDLYRLQQLITKYCPVRVIVVGDMFHSSANNDVQYFRIWRQQFPHIHFMLITGNHDILEPAMYDDLRISLQDTLSLRNIFFVHDAADTPETLKDQYVLSGHIHPGVRLVGYGKQSLRLPCFYFGPDAAVLPAFSHFTGTYSLEPEPASAVFVIAEKKVFRV